MSPDCWPTVCVWFDGLTIKGSLQQSQEGNRGRERQAPNVSLAIPGIIQAWRACIVPTEEEERASERARALSSKGKPRKRPL